MYLATFVERVLDNYNFFSLFQLEISEFCPWNMRCWNGGKDPISVNADFIDFGQKERGKSKICIVPRRNYYILRENHLKLYHLKRNHLKLLPETLLPETFLPETLSLKPFFVFHLTSLLH